MAPKNIIALVGIILLVCLVGGLNSQMQKHTVADTSDDDDDDNKPAASQQVPPKPTATPTPIYVANTTATAPVAEAIVGDPTAKSILTIGYTWTPGLQVKQDDLKSILNTAQVWAHLPGRQLKVVCVDIPADQRQYPGDADVPVGVTLNGKQVNGTAGNPGEDISSATFDKALATLK